MKRDNLIKSEGKPAFNYHKEYMQNFHKQIFGRDKKFYMYLTYSYYISFQVFSPFH